MSENSSLILFDEEDTLSVTEGMVTISKSGDWWLVEYELTLENVKRRKGNLKRRLM